ncbi:SRPBCC domain-containing protein [Ornithinibacillus sp. L9]|uniref:SRPBCC domain-containing protein n=1 Tax=Ornithinibacillus caprae TaxID=2678566 RepID=A0A6N8FPM8_9BACI|nr:SRPBCC domain-containing protein [Ornithinibacillus caprae]MUK89819.1 SRPBCC domain-containing protein [Ornithinibacillus caprae]
MHTIQGNTLTNTITIQASIQLVWHAWTISERVSEWFAPKAEIDLRVGGAFELYFIPENTSTMNTKGCKIIRVLHEKELQFTWKGPDQFTNIMNQENELTIVHVNFHKIDQETTNVTINHSGFKEGNDWQEAMKWHQTAWTDVLSSLKSALEKGAGNLCCHPIEIDTGYPNSTIKR